MSLSIMQEIFILLEDEKEVPFFRLKRWGRPARGSLAKLKSLNLIEKKVKEKETYYQITAEGEAYVDQILSAVKNEKWDNKWRLVMFEIPETQRSLRDKLRRRLETLGLGLLQASVWISPEDIKQEIEDINKEFKLGTKLKFFEVNATQGLNEQIIEKSWDMPAVNHDLEVFVKEATWAMKAMGKGNGDRFNAKKFIFEYAFILKKGPHMPLEFIEKNEIRQKAHETYLKLRKFAT